MYLLKQSEQICGSFGYYLQYMLALFIHFICFHFLDTPLIGADATLTEVYMLLYRIKLT